MSDITHIRIRDDIGALNIGQHAPFHVSHRQWVFTIPKVLRKLFYKDRLLLAELARCAAATILELYRAIFPDNHFRPGIIASTQTFGDLLIWHLSACLPAALRRRHGRTGRSAHPLSCDRRRI